MKEFVGYAYAYRTPCVFSIYILQLLTTYIHLLYPDVLYIIQPTLVADVHEMSILELADSAEFDLAFAALRLCSDDLDELSAKSTLEGGLEIRESPINGNNNNNNNWQAARRIGDIADSA